MGSSGKYMDCSMSVFLILWTFVGLISVAQSQYDFDTGTIGEICANMTPSNAGPQTDEPPYAIEFVGSFPYYNTSVPVIIKIAGLEKYEGILLQARVNGSDDDTPIGTFSGASLPDGIQLLNCTADNDTIVHSVITTTKNNGSQYEWIAPQGETRTIVFEATVWTDETTYYQIMSTTLSLDPADNINPTSTVEDTMTTSDNEEVSSSSENVEAEETSTSADDTEVTSSMSDDTETSSADDDMMSSSVDDGGDTATTSADNEMSSSVDDGDDTTSSSADDNMQTTSEAMMMTTSENNVMSSSDDDDVMSSSTSDDDVMSSSTSDNNVMSSSTSDNVMMSSSDNDAMSSSDDDDTSTMGTNMESSADQISPSSTVDTPQSTAEDMNTTSTTTTTAAPTTPAKIMAEVKAEFKTNETYVAELGNTSSAEYTEKKLEVEQDVNKTFENVEGYQGIKDVVFANGSIRVTFTAIFLRQASTASSAVSDATELQNLVTNTIKAAINNGTLSLPIDVNSIKSTSAIYCPAGTMIVQIDGSGGTCQADDNGAGYVTARPVLTLTAAVFTIVLSVFGLNH